MSWWTKYGRRALKNTALAVAAPFTAGLSTLAMEDNAGNSVMGTLTGENSAREQNRKQQKLQQQTNDTSIALANSAHQREVADLKAAGLNPVLSAGGSGAATPTLGTAQVQNTLPGGALAQAQSAGQVASLFSSAKQMAAEAKLKNTQEQLQPAIAQSEIAKNQADATLSLIEASNKGTKTTAMKNAENLANTWWGRNVSPILADIGQIFGGAGSAGITAATSARNATKMSNAIKNKPAPVINHWH